MLDQLDPWDDVTAAAAARLAPSGPLQFFTTAEERTGDVKAVITLTA